MKIYRGPSTKDLSDDTHELVAQKDLTPDSAPWHARTRVRVNISKDAHERQAVAHIEFEPADVFALEKSLWEGLKKRSDELDVIKQELATLRSAMKEICNIAILGDLSGDPNAITKVRSKAKSALGIKSE
jgi:hypothetical protein